MKYLRIVEDIVTEIIPSDDPIFPGIPITDRYAPDFLQGCESVEGTVDVQTGYIKTDNGFEAPPMPEPSPAIPSEPTPAEQIAALKTKLAATDYKIIKCSEYQLAGLDAPYDIATLHAERQAIRDEINALEAQNE